jgi:hypothetical protein
VETALGPLFVVDHLRAHPIAAGADAWITFGERGTIVMPRD